MSFSPKVKEKVLVASGRCCCICHKFCGLKIEVHHIIEVAEGGHNTFKNAIPLCFDCHADMRSYDKKHPKGNKYSETELKAHRDNWYKKIEGNIGVANQNEINETDKKVYEILIKILPWEGSMSFIKENNFAGFSFELKELQQLHDFFFKTKNPTLEFIDPDLESIKCNLRESINDFLSKISVNTLPTGNHGWNSVPEELEIDQPEQFDKVVELLHNSADEVIERYNIFVRTATRKLGILLT